MVSMQELFKSLLLNYTQDTQRVQMYWVEIEKAYGARGRFYHNLSHLESLIRLLNEVKSEIIEWDALLFALFYHDLIYNVRRTDNEVRSAQLAVNLLRAIDVPAATIEKCRRIILATQGHELSTDGDVNFFIDADLSILGQDTERYALYCRQVRKEYRLYPDFLYKPGRRKVVQQFLNRTQIYKTQYFSQLFEGQSRINLAGELATL
jgi:predicted metal-dependent HD superfamily phosphohydrolase